jgi:hypothetical protein
LRIISRFRFGRGRRRTKRLIRYYRIV